MQVKPILSFLQSHPFFRYRAYSLHPGSSSHPLHCVYYHQCWRATSSAASPPFWRISCVCHLAQFGPPGCRVAKLRPHHANLWPRDARNDRVLPCLPTFIFRKAALYTCTLYNTHALSTFEWFCT
jgi:hypothetical protein